MTCACNPELTSKGYHRVECPQSGRPLEEVLVAQSASHDYLRMATDIAEEGEWVACPDVPELGSSLHVSELVTNAALAEVTPREMGEEKNPAWCGCMVCQAVLTAARLHRYTR